MTGATTAVAAAFCATFAGAGIVAMQEQGIDIGDLKSIGPFGLLAIVLIAVWRWLNKIGESMAANIGKNTDAVTKNNEITGQLVNEIRTMANEIRGMVGELRNLSMMSMQAHKEYASAREHAVRDVVAAVEKIPEKVDDILVKRGINGHKNGGNGG